MPHGSQKQPPPGLGHDRLFHLIETAFQNAKATHAHLSGLADQFVKAEEFYRVCMEEPWKGNRRTPISLIIKSWSSYNASIVLAMSGFCSETYTMTRNTIEWGAYSAVMFLDQELIPIWENRMNSEADRKVCRSTFKQNTIIDHIRSLDTDLAERYSTIYETTIDRGAHPNVEGLRLTEVETHISDSERRVEIAALSADVELIQETLDTAIDAGVLVRDMIMRIFESWES